MYRADRFQEARQELSTLIGQHSDKPEIAEAYYLRGLCEIRLRNRAAGRRDLERAAEETDRPDLRSRARATLGSMAYEDEDCEQAAEHLKEAVAGLPKRPPLDEFLLRLGTCLQRTGQWKASRLVLARVMHEFGRRATAKEARRKYSWPYEYFSIQSGAFRSSGNAQQLVAKFRGAGLDARYRLDPQTSGGLHVVYVGQYLKWSQAKRELPRVQRVEPKAMIVP